MNNFTTGFIAGSVVGAVGLTWALSDGRTRKRMAKDTQKAVNKAGEVFSSMSHTLS